MSEIKNKTITRVCISDSVCSLLTYILISTKEDLESTCFFTSEGIHESVRNQLPNHKYIPMARFLKSRFSKIRFLFYLVFLRFTATMRWRFLKTAKIFAMDQLYYSGALIGNRHYIALADGPNCFANLLATKDYQTVIAPENQGLRMRIVRFFLGCTWHQGHGVSRNCDEIVSITPDRLPVVHDSKRNLVYPLEKLWAEADAEKRENVLRIFGITPEDVETMKRCKVVLLTQQLATEGTVTEDELAGIYRDLLSGFSMENVMIKRHPRDRMDYARYFPEAYIYDRFAPMQIFAMLGITFEVAATLFSSSVTSFKDARIIWGGSEVHPNIKKRYGIQPIPEKR